MKLKQYIIEAGEAAGKMEMVNTPVEKARAYAEKLFAKKGQSIDEEMPDFDKNYKFVQKMAGMGRTLRKDMPTIEDEDVKRLQARLKKGNIDMTAPFAPGTDPKNPFPEGLQGKEASEFVKNGLKSHDGDADDDKIKVAVTHLKVSDLKPIQKQIYFDKAIGATVESGIADTTTFLKKSFFIISADNFIIDGHHRFLSANLVDPNMKIKALQIHLPIHDLLPLTRAYGDALGHKRNA